MKIMPRQRLSSSVNRNYPNIFNTPQNLGEVKNHDTPCFKFKPTLTKEMVTPEGIEKILKEQLNATPKEAYEACRKEIVKGESLGTRFMALLRTLYAVPKELCPELHRVITEDAEKSGLGPLRKRKKLHGGSKIKKEKKIYDNLEFITNELKIYKNLKKLGFANLAEKLDITPAILRAIEIYYVNKELTLAPDYLEILSQWHMFKLDTKETMSRAFIGSESIKKELRKNPTAFLVKVISYEEGFLPKWFYKVRLCPRTKIEFDSERRIKLYQNATLTPLDIRDLYKESVELWGYARCAITGDRLFYDYWVSQQYKSKTCNVSIDRLTEDCQYAKGEVQLTTRIANVSKQTMTNSQFDVFCRKVVKYQKELKNKTKKPVMAGQLDLWPLE